MYSLENLLSPSRVQCTPEGLSFKRLFETIANLIHHDCPNIASASIISNLNAREKLGSTGLGNGIAIPHARLEGLEAPIGCMITLREGTDFNAIDSQPVDIVFALLVPSEACDEHLQILASLVELFMQPDFCQQVRRIENADTLYQLMIDRSGGHIT